MYKDRLIEFKEDYFILKNYYFPSMTSKKILHSDIKKIEIKEPTLMSGKWRIFGTGNIRTWFPMDSQRPKRDKIFIITYQNKWFKTGFTVENSEKAEEILRQKDLIC